MINLEIKSKFADWIKNRIDDTQAEENFDYICVSKSLETQRDDGQQGISKSKEYIISLDLAKEFAMLEKNEKGKEIRRYFIEFEKNSKDIIEKLRSELKVIKSNNNKLEEFLRRNEKLIDDYQKLIREYQNFEEARTIDKKIKELHDRKRVLIDGGYYIERGYYIEK